VQQIIETKQSRETEISPWRRLQADSTHRKDGDA